MCQKLRQMRQKAGNRAMFMKADRVLITDRRGLQTEHAAELRGAGSRYGLPYLFVGPKMARGKSMRTTSVHVVRIATKGPGDVSGLLSLIEQGKIDPKSIVAILGKTEGNGGVNDFTREYAVSALSAALAPYVDLPPHRVEQRIAFVMSGGTEGVLSPHITVFTRDGAAKSRFRRHFREAPEHRDRTDAGFFARGTRARRADQGNGKGGGCRHGRCCHRRSAGRPFCADQMSAFDQRPRRSGGCPWESGPLQTAHMVRWRIPVAHRRLGVAVALGEIEGKIDDEQVLRRFDLFSSVASTSAGVELMHNVVIVMGNSTSSADPFEIGHAVMRDAIDSAAVIRCVEKRGTAH